MPSKGPCRQKGSVLDADMEMEDLCVCSVLCSGVDVPVPQNQLPQAEHSQPERESGMCVFILGGT